MHVNSQTNPNKIKFINNAIYWCIVELKATFAKKWIADIERIHPKAYDNWHMKLFIQKKIVNNVVRSSVL